MGNQPEIESESAAAPLDPDRIRLARDLRSLTQRDVVERMQSPVSAAALSQFETGKSRPTPPVQADLATALDVPVGFFSAQWPGSSEDDPPYFRDLRSTRARERRRAAAIVIVLRDLLAASERYVRLPPLDVPSIPVPLDAQRGEIAEAAAQVRRLWSLGTEPVPHVVRELERHGVAVARLRFGEHGVDAFSSRSGSRPIVILTSDKEDNYVRSRFDAAHELGHLVMHGSEGVGSKEIERQAQDFASEFLLPADVAFRELPRQLDRAGWGQLAEMKRRWGISMSALLYRAKGIGVIPAGVYTNAMKYMSSRGWRRSEPGDRELGPPEAPLLLERTLRRIEVEEGMSLEDLSREARLPESDVKDLIQASVDPRPVIEL